MSAAPRILFYADCGAQIGGGHVMRCLTLAEAAVAKGAVCAFAAPPEAAAILSRFGSGDVEILPAIGGDPARATVSVAEVADDWQADWVLVDHYRLDRRHETRLRAEGRRIAVIDDLAERRRDADLILDPSYGRSAAAYDGLASSGATILTGPRFALVRPAFAEARPAALARRSSGSVRRALVSLGLTDVDGVTGRVVDALLPELGEIVLDVVVGPAAPSLEGLQRLAAADSRVRLHVETLQMAPLTAQADLAIGAGGSSTWERCCLGLPTLTLILADNQRPLAMAFERDGISPAIEASAQRAMVDIWRRLVGDGAWRARLSAAAARLCDGLGAGRAAGALLRV